LIILLNKKPGVNVKKFFLFLMLMTNSFFACTSIIISGKASADGRPIMWKHRDSDYEQNKLMYFQGPKYYFIGVVNSVDAQGKEVWMGSNNTGFSIINTASYNLNDYSTCNAPSDQEGLLMKEALGRFSTVKEFEEFLNREKGKWGVEANFGVIDAKGGAAYFEVDCKTVTKYDVNDPTVAPNGYLVRTNFSCSGKEKEGYGYFRYETATKFFDEAYKNKNLTVNFVLEVADRNLQHSTLGNDLYKSDLPKDTADKKFIHFRDYIVRNSSTSTMIIQGVKPGEDPALTTLWTVLGWQLTTIVTPVWVAAGSDLPAVTVASGKETAPLNKKALVLKEKCFPLDYDNGKDYLNLSAVLNKKGNGIVQTLIPKEKPIVEKATGLVDGWRKNKFNKEEAIGFYKWLDEYVTEVYKAAYGI
jgi:hypothetical protein